VVSDSIHWTLYSETFHNKLNHRKFNQIVVLQKSLKISSVILHSSEQVEKYHEQEEFNVNDQKSLHCTDHGLNDNSKLGMIRTEVGYNRSTVTKISDTVSML